MYPTAQLPSVFTQPWIQTGVSALLCLTLLPACASEPTATAPAVDATEVAEATTETDLSEQIGEFVVFNGQFDTAISESLFAVQEERRAWGSVLVLNRSNAFKVPSDTAIPLWIQGTVATLNPTELQATGIPEDQWADYEGQPVIIADSITLTPDPAQLISNAEAFYDQEITVYGEIEPITAANTFVLKNPELFAGRGIILIEGAEADLGQVVGAENAVVTGVLRPYVIANLEKDYSLTWDLEVQQQLEADFAESPVLVVTDASPVED